MFLVFLAVNYSCSPVWNKVRPCASILQHIPLLTKETEMRNIFLSIGILALIFLASCAPLFGPRPILPAASQKLPALEGNWQIQFSQSGGIMGISRSLMIASDGQVTATDKRTQQTVPDRLGSAALAQLKALAAAATYPTVTPAIACADCFYYRLEINGVSQPLSIQLIELILNGSGLEPLFDFLHDEMVKLLGN
jgi:hypothetical protein